ncbi:MAG: DUF881 domain-containing protein [Clostridiales Family XIII bacterium]|jgi:uncharacterized protein YlxW (UPF0749 family)|nr:DUF881 domain-containing protein [Clostridiales Family XIII bacterium]
MRIRTIMLFAVSICIGFSIIAQANSTDGMNLFVSRKTISDLEISIGSEQLEIDNIRKRTEEAERKLGEYEKIMADADDSLHESLLSELSVYRAMTAFTEVHGPGVRVVVDDSTADIPAWIDINAFIVHDTDILRIISDLSKGGAEAISINGHRMYSGSTINCNGYTVRINDIPEAKPFIIEAIGDPARLSAAMIGPNSYGVSLREYYGMIFTVQVEPDIVLPARPAGAAFRYAQHADRQTPPASEQP